MNPTRPVFEGGRKVFPSHVGVLRTRESEITETTFISLLSFFAQKRVRAAERVTTFLRIQQCSFPRSIRGRGYHAVLP